MVEFVEELLLASPSGFKSKHDDCIDTISMLSQMSLWKPNTEIDTVKPEEGNVYSLRYYHEDDDDTYRSDISSYFV